MPTGAIGRSRWLVAGILVLLAVLILAVFIFRTVHAAPGVKLNETRQTPSAGGIHVTAGSAIAYQYTPPSSGPHYPSPATWGQYPQGLPPGTWVHNLEHGGIAILYQCAGTCTDTQKQISAAYDQIPDESKFHERKVVTTPYANLDHLVRVQAWGWTMPLDTVDAAAITSFYNEHANKGPELIP